MEVNGKEFMRNLEIEQEKEELHQQALKLDAEKRKSVKPSPSYFDGGFDQKTKIEKEVYEDIVDLKLDNNVSDNNELFPTQSTVTSKKKKYIILGVALVLLFIITILALRLVSNNQTEQELINNDSRQVKKNEILDKIDTNEQYQEKLEQKQQFIDEKKVTVPQQEEKINDIPLPKIEDTPIVIDTPKQNLVQKRDLFGLEAQKHQEQPKAKIEKKITKKIIQPKKTVIKKKIQKTKKKVYKSNSTKGYFIQIGAYSKQPSQKLLKSISNKGYKYQIKKINIKGRLYNKVLIGSFSTKSDAKRSLNKVRKDFKNPSAYILRF